MEGQAVVTCVLALVIVLGCGSSPPADKPIPPTPADPGAGSGSGSSGGARTVIVKTPFSLEVLGLEARGGGSDASALAQRLTAELRTAAREYDAIGLGSKNHELVDELIMSNCSITAAPCMAKIAHGLGAERIIYGSVELAGGKLDCVLTLLVAETQYTIEWTGSGVATDDATLRNTAREAMASLLSRAP